MSFSQLLLATWLRNESSGSDFEASLVCRTLLLLSGSSPEAVVDFDLGMSFEGGHHMGNPVNIWQLIYNRLSDADQYIVLV